MGRVVVPAGSAPIWQGFAGCTLVPRPRGRPRDVMVTTHRQGPHPHVNDSPGKQAIKEIHNKCIITGCDEHPCCERA